jgi:hypothetical protein
MTDTPDPTYRSRIDAPADSVSLREAEEVDGDEGMMEVRMPIASTGQVRNEGDDPLTADELSGMGRQIDTLGKGVFPEHGRSGMDPARYSQFEKLGYWADADLAQEAAADGNDLLMATARMPDPETLPAATGQYRQRLAVLKEQAKRGIPMSASIGWREDDDAPGGNDLMEASIVGIGADPRTATEGGTEALARAAVDAGADPSTLVAEVARAVAPEDERPFGPPDDPNRWDSWDECIADAQDMDDVDSPEEFCGWAKAQTESESDADAPEDSHDMSDTDDTPDDEPGDTTDEQTADDGETTERAPEDVTEDDLLTFTAMHFDGMDEGDMAEAVDASDAEYIGECDAEALYDFVSIVTGAEYGAVEDAMGELMQSEQGDYGDDEDMDDDEEDDDEEQSSDEPDSEQSADTEDSDTSDLAERIADLEDALADVRSGDADVDTPDTDTDEERDADESDDSEDEPTREAPDPTEGLGDYR